MHSTSQHSEFESKKADWKGVRLAHQAAFTFPAWSLTESHNEHVAYREPYLNADCALFLFYGHYICDQHFFHNNMLK